MSWTLMEKAARSAVAMVDMSGWQPSELLQMTMYSTDSTSCAVLNISKRD